MIYYSHKVKRMDKSMKNAIPYAISGVATIVLATAAIVSVNNREAAHKAAEARKADNTAIVINSGKTQLQAATDKLELQVEKTQAVCKWAGGVQATSKVPRYTVPAECTQATVNPQ
jgi:hypothetical protein